VITLSTNQFYYHHTARQFYADASNLHLPPQTALDLGGRGVPATIALQNAENGKTRKFTLYHINRLPDNNVDFWLYRNPCTDLVVLIYNA
jgi:hypothetical protein